MPAWQSRSRAMRHNRTLRPRGRRVTMRAPVLLTEILMEIRNLGGSGLRVSAVGIGCNNFGMRIDLEASRKA